MLSLSELKAIVKADNIKRCSFYNKPELLALLRDRGLIPDEEEVQTPKKPREDDPKYYFLKYIRK